MPWEIESDGVNWIFKDYQNYNPPLNLVYKHSRDFQDSNVNFGTIL